MWRFVTNNWQIKLLALALAVVVWMYANSVVIKTTDIDVNFEIDNPESVDVAVMPADRVVRLKLSGPTGVINDLSRRRIQLGYKLEEKDLSEEGGVRTIPFQESMVRNLPAQVQVESFTPKTFELTVRPLAEKRFTVVLPKVPTVGAPSRGYTVAWATIRGRNEVRVRGPVAVLRRIESELGGRIETMPVDVSNRAEPFVEMFWPVDSQVKFADGSEERISCTETVEVAVEIKPADVESVVKGVQITLRVAPGFKNEVAIESENPVDVPIVGPPDAVSKVAAESLDAYIDIRARKPETEKEVPFTEKLIVRGLPAGVKLAKDVHVKARFRLPTKAPGAGGAP